jgi:hypothetical protein
MPKPYKHQKKKKTTKLKLHSTTKLKNHYSKLSLPSSLTKKKKKKTMPASCRCPLHRNPAAQQLIGTQQQNKANHWNTTAQQRNSQHNNDLRHCIGPFHSSCEFL